MSFDSQSAPDRISAKAGLKELKRVAPTRKYELLLYSSIFTLLYMVLYLLHKTETLRATSVSNLPYEYSIKNLFICDCAS